MPAASSGLKSAASVPRAGETMRPETPCSRIEAMHLALPIDVLAGIGEEVHEAGRLHDLSMPTASSAKKGLVRSLTTMPTILEAPSAQIGGAAVIDVAELADRGLAPWPRVCSLTSALALQDER